MSKYVTIIEIFYDMRIKYYYYFLINNMYYSRACQDYCNQ